MTSAYSQLYFGLAGAIVLIYLVIVVNFQSWLDPFIIITALPGALAGIVWMLFMTGTTLSVPALTGAIMCMGIATANSILLVSFAREGLAARPRCRRGRARSRLHPFPSGADDGARHDHRHAADGVCARRRRRAERAARPRRDRRPAGRDRGDAVLRPTSSSACCMQGASGRAPLAEPATRIGRLTGASIGEPMASEDHQPQHETTPTPPPRNLRQIGIIAVTRGGRHRRVRHFAAAQPRGRSHAMDARAGGADRRPAYAARRRRDPATRRCPAPSRPGTRRRSTRASAAI